MDLKLTWSKDDKNEDQNGVIENAAKKLPYSKTKILAALSQSVLELQKKLDNLSTTDKDDYSDLEDKLKEHNDLIVEIKESINTLNDQIEELKRANNDTSRLDDLRSEITRLNGKNVALETKMENLRSNVNAQLTEMQNKWFKGEINQPSEPSIEEPEAPTDDHSEPNNDTENTLDLTSTSEPVTPVEDNKAVTANNDLDSLLTNLRNIRI